MSMPRVSTPVRCRRRRSTKRRTPRPDLMAGFEFSRRAALGVALFALPECVMPAQADDAKDRALITAAGRGDAAAVQKLLQEGASVQARDRRGRTALLAATHD